MAIVERITERGVRGWAAHDEETGNAVVIKVNGVEVATTKATRTMQFNGQPRECAFSRYLTDLWSSLRTTDEVTFEHNGQRIPIVGRGFVYMVPEDGEKEFSYLMTRIEQGWLFDKR